MKPVVILFMLQVSKMKYTMILTLTAQLDGGDNFLLSTILFSDEFPWQISLQKIVKLGGKGQIISE